MDLETRVKNLETTFAAMINMMNNNKFYTDADIAGARHSATDSAEQLKADLDFIAMETGVDL